MRVLVALVLLLVSSPALAHHGADPPQHWHDTRIKVCVEDRGDGIYVATKRAVREWNARTYNVMLDLSCHRPQITVSYAAECGRAIACEKTTTRCHGQHVALVSSRIFVHRGRWSRYPPRMRQAIVGHELGHAYGLRHWRGRRCESPPSPLMCPYATPRKHLTDHSARLVSQRHEQEPEDPLIDLPELS